MDTIDWITIGGYLIVVIGIGLYFSRRSQTSVESYFVSGRSLPWWLAGMSMMASVFAVETPVGITGLVAEEGIPGVWYAWSLILGSAGALGAFILASLFRRSRIITPAELVELRYDGRSAAFLRGFKGVYFGIFTTAITLGWVIKAMWTVAAVVVPDVNPHLLLAVILLITLFYTTLSGLWGVVATDVIQFVIGVIGSVTLAVFAWRHIGGIEAVISGFTERYGAEAAVERLSFLPSLSSPFFLTFIVFITLNGWRNALPPITQRIVSSRNEKHASFATIFFSVVAFGFSYWPVIFTALVSLVVFPTLAAPEAGYAMLIVKLIPAGFLGIMLASLLAAFMSTVDTHLNFGASFLLNDLYRRFIRRQASERHYLWISRAATVLMLFFGVAVAYCLESVVDAWYTMAMLTAGYGMLMVVRWFWWRVNAWAEIAALVSSAAAATVLSPGVGKLIGYWAYIGPLSWQARLVAVVIVCTVSWIVVCLMTQPTSKAQLKRFCETVKPFPALWGPIYKEFPDLGWSPHLARSCWHWLLGAAAVYSFCFGVGSLMFLELAQGILMILAAFLMAVIILMTWRSL